MRFDLSEIVARILRVASPVPHREALPAPSPAEPADSADLTRHAAALLAGLAGCEALAPHVSVRWNPRLRSTAGQAFPKRARVTLNPRLTQFPGETERTLRHELAHLVAFWRGGRRGRRIAAHGPEWRHACAELGIADETRCHRLPLPRQTLARPHVYRCPSCGATLARARRISSRRPLACVRCCRRFAGGRFDRRFVFVRAEDSGG